MKLKLAIYRLTAEYYKFVYRNNISNEFLIYLKFDDQKIIRSIHGSSSFSNLHPRAQQNFCSKGLIALGIDFLGITQTNEYHITEDSLLKLIIMLHPDEMSVFNVEI